MSKKNQMAVRKSCTTKLSQAQLQLLRSLFFQPPEEKRPAPPPPVRESRKKKKKKAKKTQSEIAPR